MNTDFVSELGLNALIRIKESSWNGKNYVELESVLDSEDDKMSF